MISVTQPRRPADDFLASLQANLQHQPQRRIRERPPRTLAPTKSKVTAPSRFQDISKGDIHQKVEAKASKQKTGQVKARQVAKEVVSKKPKDVKGKTKSVDVKSAINKDVTEPQSIQSSITSEAVTAKLPPTSTNANEATVTQISQPPPEHFPTQPVPQEIPQIASNLIAQEAISPTYQPVITRQSKNNFYMKNQSNIFGSPVQYGSTVPDSQSTARDNAVVNNALRIASQQPLAGLSSFSNSRSQGQNRNNVPSNPILPSTHHETVNQVQQQAVHPLPGQTKTKPILPIQQETLKSSYVTPNAMPTNVQQHHNISNSLLRNENSLPSKTVQPEVIPATSSTTAKTPYNSHYYQSFSISGGNDRSNKLTQEQERKKWIQELEAQVREKKLREQQEKEKERGTSYTSFQNNSNPQPQITTQQTTGTSLNPPPATATVSQSTHQPPFLPPHPISTAPTDLTSQDPGLASPLQTTVAVQPPSHQSPQNTSSLNQLGGLHGNHLTRQSSAEDSPQNRMLGQNAAWVDPLELERRQEARRRALENQETIRRQVEERDRLRKEEQDRIKREEEQEMRRIEAENQRMAAEVMAEQEKARRKEAAQMKQIADMRQKIEEANRKAQESKQRKRNRGDGNDSPALVTRVTTSVIEEEAEQKADIPTGRISTVTAPAHKEPEPKPVIMRSNLRIPQTADTVAARVVSHVSTQTVNEVSCQTEMVRENSFLESESRLIQLKDRELSLVQKCPPPKKDTKTEPTRSKNSGKGNKTKQPPAKDTKKTKETAVPGSRRGSSRRNAEKPKFNYDNNGRRIRRASPIAEVVETVNKAPKPATPSDILAQESVAITDYKSVTDIFDDPQPVGTPLEMVSVDPSPVPAEPSPVKPSPFVVPEQSIQLRYTSPNNESRSIPSAISARQNDILSQLEKLRMGLKNRRREMSSDEIIVTH